MLIVRVFTSLGLLVFGGIDQEGNAFNKRGPTRRRCHRRSSSSWQFHGNDKPNQHRSGYYFRVRKAIQLDGLVCWPDWWWFRPTIRWWTASIL
jgi:hypothetical protein